MNQGVPVACRTRSKRRVAGSGLRTSVKRRRVDGRVVDLVCLDDEEGPSGKIELGSEALSSPCSLVKAGFEFLGESDDDPEEVIAVGESDDGRDAEKGLRHCKKKPFEGEKRCKEEKGSFEDDEYGGRREKPVVMARYSDEDSQSEEEHSEDESDSEDGETSDEDFRVDDDGLEIECSSSEDSDSSYGDDNDDDDNESASESVEIQTNSRTKQNNSSEKTEKERARKVESATESSGVWRRKVERKDSEEEQQERVGPDCASATSCKSAFSKEERQKAEEKHEAKRVESASADAEVFVDHFQNSSSSTPPENEARNTSHQSVSQQKETGDSAVAKKVEKNDNVHVNASVSLDIEEHDSESEREIDMLWDEMDRMLRDEETEIGDSPVVKKRNKNNNANVHDCVNFDEHEGRKRHNHDRRKGVRNLSSFKKSQDRIGHSAEYVIREDKGKLHKRWFNSHNREKVRVVDDDEAGDKYHQVLRMPSRTKDQGFKFFTECFWGKHDSVKNDSIEFEEKVGQGQTPPLACRGGIPLNWGFTKEERIEKTESEKELDMLWGELEMVLRAEEIGFQVGNIGTYEASENPASQCKHDTIFNEEIGIQCRWCGWIVTEIKYITPPFVNSERSGRKGLNSGVNAPQFDGDLFNGSGNDSEAVWCDGTVWDLIPDIKQSLYPHQQEGFEFIWKNLAGSIDLADIKSVDPRSEGGCIISHAPGTGKTRLTMVFLETYLQVFPRCQPVIIAPASILLTWEDELRKWNIGIPFHNLNNADLTGKELVINEFDWSGNQQYNKDAIRMVKLCSWFKEKSILLISYNLYEKLAGGKSEADGEKEKKKRKMKKEKRARTREHIEKPDMGKVLRDIPGLLILDEGHTPRNHRSCIWKVLSESRTKKRILLSGTPFQNNFMELYNILCLMKPSFPDSIPQELKKFCQSRPMHDRQTSKDVNWEPADDKINQLKMLMTPFVNVHKGSILQKNLPGLRDCVLVLQPDSFQQQMLESIGRSQNKLNFEHKLALVAVHPSLFLNCSLSEKEEAVIDKDRLEKLRPKPYGGVKTKFLMELVKLCDAVNEKVLVFSQYIDTLNLIKEHLKSTFNWSEDTEVLHMYGKVDQKQKQSLIHTFNEANSRAKVLLASIKACSEGINLTGASRVVLLDVVWNPSVKRQAIYRAYRLGQKRVVYTYHLLAQDTLEFTKFLKQAQKDRLSELVFSNKNSESDMVKSCGAEFEDKVLDVMLQHKNLKDIFAECYNQRTDIWRLAP